MPDTFFDELFEERFFDFAAEVEMQIEPTFPLPPPDASKLPEFLASAEGRKLKRAGRESIQSFTDWSNANGVDPSALVQFKQDFIEYKGWQGDGKVGPTKEEDVRRIPFYREGMPAFEQLSKLLETPKVALTFKQDLLRNLFKSIAVCSPGTHTNIVNAYLDFVAQMNLAMKWMVFRRRLAEQYTLSLLTPYSVNKAMEIHYVNRVVNENKSLISVNEVDDRYQALCTKSEIDAISVEFILNIPKTITPQAILEMLLSEISYEELPQKVNDALGEMQNTLEEFTKSLDKYGLEGDVNFIAASEILKSDDYVTYQLSWQAKYIILISLMHRMQEGGYLKKLDKHSPLLTAKVYLATPRSLRLSYVHIPDACDRVFYRPFLSYYVLNIADASSQLLEWINSEGFSAEERMELVIAIGEYADSLDKEADADELKALAEHLNRLIQNEVDMKVLIERLPGEALRSYLQSLQIPEYLSVLTNENMLHRVLENATDEVGLEILKALVTHKPKFFSRHTPFWFAVYYGNLAAVKYFADKNPTYLGKATTEGEMPLFTAVRRGHREVIDEMLRRRKVGLNRKNNHGELPLYVAARHGQDGVIQELLRHGVQVNKPILNGETPLFAAAEAGHHGTVKLLLSKGAQAEKKDGKGQTPFDRAFDRDYLEVAYDLLPKPKCSGRRAERLLMRAVEAGNTVLAKKLLKGRVSPDLVLDSGASLLIHAISNGFNEIVWELLKWRAVQRPHLKTGETPLHIACSLNAVSLASQLIQAGGMLDAVDNNREMPHHRAAALGEEEMLRIFLDAKSSDGKTSLLTLEELNSLNAHGETALHRAATNGEAGVVRLLLGRKVEPFTCSLESNQTPFEAAIEGGQLDVVKAFVEFGQLDNLSDEERWALILSTEAKGFFDVAMILVICKLKKDLSGVTDSEPLAALLEAESWISEDSPDASVCLAYLRQIEFYERVYRQVFIKKQKHLIHKTLLRNALDEAYLSIKGAPENWAEKLANLKTISGQVAHGLKPHKKLRKALPFLFGKTEFETNLQAVEVKREAVLRSSSTRAREMLTFDERKQQRLRIDTSEGKDALADILKPNPNSFFNRSSQGASSVSGIVEVCGKLYPELDVKRDEAEGRFKEGPSAPPESDDDDTQASQDSMPDSLVSDTCVKSVPLIQEDAADARDLFGLPRLLDTVDWGVGVMDYSNRNHG